MPNDSTAPLPDYYEVLQVSPNAEAEVIQAAYRRLLIKWHPDRRPGDGTATDRTKMLNEAYEILSEVRKRQDYDKLRKNTVLNSTNDSMVITIKSSEHLDDKSGVQWSLIIVGVFVLFLFAIIVHNNVAAPSIINSAKINPTIDTETTGGVKAQSNASKSHVTPHQYSLGSNKANEIELRRREEEKRIIVNRISAKISKNEALIKEISETIESLDNVVILWASSEWQTYTNSYRLGKMPSEFYRDQLYQLIIKMESNERSRIRTIVNGARGMTMDEYCERNGFIPPQDFKSGRWMKLKSSLSELEF